MIVADASPLIALLQIGQFDLLTDLYGTVVIPPAVRQEIARQVILSGGLPAWVSEQRPRDSVKVTELRGSLDPGEAEAVALALDLGAVLLIDERTGRRITRAAGHEIVGTLGVLVRAKQTDLIGQGSPLLDQLELVDFHMSEALKQEVLRAIGEE